MAVGGGDKTAGPGAGSAASAGAGGGAAVKVVVALVGSVRGSIDGGRSLHVHVVP